MSRPALVRRAFELLEGVGANDAIAYAVELEHEVHVTHLGCPYEYRLAMLDVLSKLAANAEWLAANVPPTRFLETNWRVKCTGLRVTAAEQEAAHRSAEFRALLRQNVDSVRANTKEGTEIVKCNKCGSKDVSILLRQTRSADEGMSSFATCQGCGSRWKLG